MKEDTTQKKSSSATKTSVSKDITLVEKKTAKPTMGHEPGHTSITTKYNRKMQCYDVSKFVLGKNCSLTAKSDTVAERFAKSHCLMMVHAGVNKNISNEAIYEMYDTSMKGMESYYIMNKDIFKGQMNLEPPLRVGLNEHDDYIYKCIDVITDMKQDDPNSSYHKIKKSLFGGFPMMLLTSLGKIC